MGMTGIRSMQQGEANQYYEVCNILGFSLNNHIQHGKLQNTYIVEGLSDIYIGNIEKKKN